VLGDNGAMTGSVIPHKPSIGLRNSRGRSSP
jgi:hypothetical protein